MPTLVVRCLSEDGTASDESVIPFYQRIHRLERQDGWAMKVRGLRIAHLAGFA